MSKNISEKSQVKKTSKPIKKPLSASELCQSLNKLIQQPEWTAETVSQFIHLITNPDQQFQLTSQQQESLFHSIVNCPQKYLAIVHLTIISKNFCSENGFRTLDNIIPKLSQFIGNSLDLQDGIKENILKNLGDKQVYQFIKENLNSEEEQQTAPKRKEDSPKLDFLRNLISLLISEGEQTAILTRLNIILDILSNSNQYQKLTTNPLNQESDLKKRVEAIVELFQLVKPTANEAKRLLLYGTHAQVLASKQSEEITKLRNSLQDQIELRKQREDDIERLKKEQEELKQQLLEAEKNLQENHNYLEKERELYAQLKTSSQAKISQQREATLNTIKNRIEHELNKLERYFSSSSDNFQGNSQIGIRILKKIREQLTE